MTQTSDNLTPTTLTYAAASRRALPDLLFRNRNFVLLWAAYAVSAFGDHLSEMGLFQLQDALADQRADSTRVQAIMMFAFMLPFFVLGPAMGWLADRAPRKWIMIAADLVRACLVFSLFAAVKWLTAHAPHSLELQLLHTQTGERLYTPWLYALPLVVLGIFASMFSPSRAAMLPTLIRIDQLVRANALTNALGPLMTIISYVVGGYIVVNLGVLWNFRFNACTFVCSALFLFGIRPPSRGPAAPRARGNALAGFHYVRTHQRILELVIFATIFWIGASTVRSVVPALVKGVFHGKISDVGLYQGTLGIGILIGALTLSALGEALKAEIAISWSLVLAGVSVLWLALVASWAALGRASGFAGLFSAGFFGAGVLVGTQALIQKMVPDRYRGRVLGVTDFFSMAGLLIATGLLGIPDWLSIDRFVPLILVLIGVLFFASGLIAVRTRLKRGRYRPWVNLWVSMNYIYCKAWHRVRRIGHCTIPYGGPVIVASNHISSLDPHILVAGSPNRCLGFLIAREYYNVPVFKKIIHDIECVPVNRSGNDTASIKAALRHLHEGKSLGIFPQGGIRPPDDASPPREGVGLLALRSGAPVIPAYITGIESTKSVARPFFKRQRAVVRYGAPVDLSRFKGREKDRAAYTEASEAIMQAIRALAPNGENR